MTTPARMPTSLVILLVLLGLGVISNFVSGAIVSAILGAALVVGLIAGNDGVRRFMQGLAAIQIAWNAILIARSATAGAETYLIVLWGVVGIALPVFMIWTLGKPEVRDWMFRKNFNLDETLTPPTAIIHSERKPPTS